MKNNIIPVFYACDDRFVKYTMVSLKSMIDNASKDFKYHVHVLNINIGDRMKAKLLELENENFSIEFNDMTDYLQSVNDLLPIRDYYSKTTYYRLLIADMFPQYEKAIYIDSDTVVLGDISKFYNHDLKDNYVGACHEQVMIKEPIFGHYVERVTGVNRHEFFNAGIILINCNQFRDLRLFDKFCELLKVYNFRVTQDEDYLNVICHKKVLWIDDTWNTELFGEIKYKDEEINIIHYIMTSKPWHYRDARYKEYFWHYAKQISVYEEILEALNNYTDEQRKSDADSGDRLVQLAIDEAARDDSYYQLILKNQK